MRYTIQTFLIFAICGNLIADEKLVPVPDPISTKSAIHLPMIPVVVEPGEPPVVKPVVDPSEPEPTVVPDIRAGELFVITNETKLKLNDSRQGIVTITPLAGPFTFFANKFVDAKERGVEEHRTYKEPFIYVVQAVKAGEVEIIIAPVGAEDNSTDTRIIIQSLVGPRPPPIPDPIDPTPDPVDPVTPTKLQVVIIEDPELKSTLPPDQLAAMDGSEVRQYVKTHCSVTDGTPDFRKLSIRQNTSTAPEWIKAAFAEQRTALPFIVILTPTQTISGPLPKTVEETLTLLKKYGGE